MVLFEGSEKKLEIIIDAKKVDLRRLGVSFWQRMVETSGAKILSTISSPFCQAYLLSESSLFVWRDRCTMITCGQTKLIDAALFFLQQCPHSIAALFYQRKNELFPNMQHSTFQDDVERLNTILDGTTYRLGEQFFNNIFYYESSDIIENISYAENDSTIELLMYDLGKEATSTFINQTPKNIRGLLSKTGLWDKFDTDEFLFEPFGYSINGVRNHLYFTIHVTPQQECSYTSFETNLPPSEAQPIVHELIRALKPKSFDTVIFCDQQQDQQLILTPPIIEQSIQKLATTYYVHFTHYGDNYERLVL